MFTSESPLLSEWLHVATDLGIEVDGPVTVSLPSGASIHALVLVRHFGGAEGMLVLRDYELVKNLIDEIVQAGYGFSIMGEPAVGEEYSREVYIEVLADWGWYGPDSEQPVWLPTAPAAGG